MIDDKIIKNVIASLKERFKGAYFYESSVKQGIKTPCFFIRIINSNIKRELEERFYVNHDLAITYLPKKALFSKNYEEDTQMIKTDMLFALEELKTDSGYLYAKNLSIETNYDDFGAFFTAHATYECAYRKDKDKYYMLKLKEIGKVGSNGKENNRRKYWKIL